MSNQQCSFEICKRNCLLASTFSSRAKSSVSVVPLKRRDSCFDDDGVEVVFKAELRQLLRQLAETASQRDQIARPVPSKDGLDIVGKILEAIKMHLLLEFLQNY